MPRDPHVQRLRRSVDGRIGRHDQVLELGRLGVGRPAQDVGVAVDALEQRLDGPAAGVWVDRDGVSAEDVEESDGVACRSRSDVGPLGVEDDRDLRRDPRPDPLQGGQPR